MPMSTLELRPPVNHNMNTYGDEKYNVMALVHMCSQDPAQTPWQQGSGRTKDITKVHSVKLPTIMRSQAPPSFSSSFYAQAQYSHFEPRLNLPSVGRGIAHGTLVPFCSYAKPTCGYYFSRSTEQRKMRTGIPPRFGYLNVSAPPVGGM